LPRGHTPELHGYIPVSYLLALGVAGGGITTLATLLPAARRAMLARGVAPAAAARTPLASAAVTVAVLARVRTPARGVRAGGNIAAAGDGATASEMTGVLGGVGGGGGAPDGWGAAGEAGTGSTATRQGERGKGRLGGRAVGAVSAKGRAHLIATPPWPSTFSRHPHVRYWVLLEFVLGGDR